MATATGCTPRVAAAPARAAARSADRASATSARCGEIDDDRRPAGRERAQPRARRLERGRPAQVERDVDARRSTSIERVVVDGASTAMQRGADAERAARAAVDVERGRGGAGEQRGARRGMRAARGRERAQDLRHALLRRERAEDAEDARRRRRARARAGWHCAFAASGDGLRASLAERDVLDRPIGPGAAELSATAPREVRGDGREDVDDAARHRPLVVVRAVEAGDGELGRVRRDVGMIPGELGAIVARALRGEQRAPARVVQPRVVQHGEAGPAEEVRPDELVQPRVAELVDDRSYWPRAARQHEVVRALDAHVARTRRLGRGREPSGRRASRRRRRRWRARAPRAAAPARPIGRRCRSDRAATA